MFDDGDLPEVSMVRVLLVLAIGIPIAIEVVTFGGLVGHYVGGGDAATTPTPEAVGATAGEEILSGTAPTERVVSASVTPGEDSWQFALTVEVTAVGSAYELGVGDATTLTGDTVDGSGATTGVIPAGETGTVTGTWSLPTGQRPDTVTVTAVTTPANGTASASEHTVDIGAVPVS